MIVRLRGNRDDCVVPETIGSRRKLHSKDAVPMAVAEFLGREIIAQRQRLGEHDMITVGTKLQIKEQRSRAGNLVDEAATHAHSEIEVLNVRRLHTCEEQPRPRKSAQVRGLLLILISTSMGRLPAWQRLCLPPVSRRSGLPS